MASAQRTPIAIPGATATGSLHLGMMEAPLFVLRDADMTLTTDQTFTKCGAFTNYFITLIIAKRVSGAFNTACAGGIYTAAGKTGVVLVLATQTWETLNGSGAIKIPTLNVATADTRGRQTLINTATPILALSTGNSAALVADFYIWGKVLD